MIRAEDYGHTLRCSGCRAKIILSFREMLDLDRMLDVKAGMREALKDFDSFQDVRKARSVIKAKRRAAQREINGGGSA